MIFCSEDKDIVLTPCLSSKSLNITSNILFLKLLCLSLNIILPCAFYVITNFSLKYLCRESTLKVLLIMIKKKYTPIYANERALLVFSVNFLVSL